MNIACLQVCAEARCVHVCVYLDNVCDKWRGRRQQPHGRACNPSLPLGDGDGEIMRPSSAVCVCVRARVYVCVSVYVLADE